MPPKAPAATTPTTTTFIPSSTDTLLQPKEKYRYQTEIEQMMFVFGEVPEPLDATVQLVEDIVQHQISQLVLHSINHAQKRDSRFIAAEDLIFLIRRDPSKVHRLKSYLSWKDVRKNTSSEKDIGGGSPDAEDLLKEGGPRAAIDKSMKVKRARVNFSWDPMSSFHALIEDAEEDDEDQQEAHQAYINRRRVENEITRAMTLEEYKRWSECRRASFIYKKAKKFREWANLSAIYDSKANAEVIEILGFLAYDIVSKITETALRIKTEWDLSSRKKIPNNPNNRGVEDPSSRNAEHDDDDDEFQSSLAGLNVLFGKSTSERTPLQPSHIHAACREAQLQIRPLTNFKGGMARLPEVFI